MLHAIVELQLPERCMGLRWLAGFNRGIYQAAESALTARTRRRTSSVPSAPATWGRSGLRGDPVSSTRMTWDASRDGALVGVRVLLVDLLAGREPEVGRQLADLVEPDGDFGPGGW